VALASDQTSPFALVASDRACDGDTRSSLFVAAQEDLNRLYGIVHHATCEVLLRNDNGAVIDSRGEANGGRQYQYWRRYLDEVLAERPDRDGTHPTNLPSGSSAVCAFDVLTIGSRSGIRAPGPRRPSAPIFDAECRLIGSLEIVPRRQEQYSRTDAVLGAVLQASARAIEERLFRERYRQEWIVAVAPQDVSCSAILFALGRDQEIVGADRYARAMLAEHHAAFEDTAHDSKMTLWQLFEHNVMPFRSKHRGADIPALLMPTGAPEVWSALVTPPEITTAPWQELDSRLHVRPRIDSIGCVHQLAPAPQARGGLSPGTLRRVREHIEANLEADIDLEVLADIAGLSRCHFARAFKQSAGTTPHTYLMYRRLGKAQRLLADTDLPLAEIALETGFSDQSHFSRRFRELLDVSPSAFRRSRR
jgi:AraC-like DNA-binding protein